MRLLSRYVWRFSSSKKEIYLTFDDGPTEEITDFVLKELHKYDAKATFFCLGKNIQAHPEIFKKIKNNGHRVGNHTQQHLNGWKTNKEDYLENILKCEQIIDTSEGHHKTGSTRQEQKLFRPPYGKIKKSQTTALLKKDYKIVLWDVLSADFDKNISKEKCLKNVLENVQNGSIVVFHDSIKARAKVQFTLPIVLAELTSQGYIFKAI